jgi:hypothetical protein
MRLISVEAAFFIALGMGTVAAPAAPIEVDVELVLAGDVSSSMCASELRLQRDGFVTAFRHPEVMRAILSGMLGRIAVTYVEWAGPGEQWITVPWTVISDRQTAEAFAEKLSTAPIAEGSLTSISDGLLFAANQFNANSTTGFRKTIDVSGDGPNNAGPSLVAVRNHILRQGVTINGLSFTSCPGEDARAGPGPFPPPSDPAKIHSYYEHCVIGGLGAFSMTSNDLSQFPVIIRRKLVLEIAAAPARALPAKFTDRSVNSDSSASSENHRQLQECSEQP